MSKIIKLSDIVFRNTANRGEGNVDAVVKYIVDEAKESEFMYIDASYSEMTGRVTVFLDRALGDVFKSIKDENGRPFGNIDCSDVLEIFGPSERSIMYFEATLNNEYTVLEKYLHSVGASIKDEESELDEHDRNMASIVFGDPLDYNEKDRLNVINYISDTLAEYDSDMDASLDKASGSITVIMDNPLSSFFMSLKTYKDVNVEILKGTDVDKATMTFNPLTEVSLNIIVNEYLMRLGKSVDAVE